MTNELIPLQIQQPNINRTLFDAVQQQTETENSNAMAQEQIRAARGQNDQVEQQRELMSLTKGAIDTLGFIENNDIEGLQNYFGQREQEILSRGGNPQDTRRAMALLSTGRVDELRNRAQQVVSSAERLGLINQQSRQGTFGKDFKVAIDEQTGERIFVQADGRGGFLPVQGIRPEDPNASRVNLQTDLQTQTPQGIAETTRAQREADLSQIKLDEAERKKIEAESKAEAQKTSLREQANFIADQTQIAADLARESPDGRLGAVMSVLNPTGDSGQLARVLETIGSNIAFGTLIRMKQESPTGGALGAVSERELRLLQSNMGNLDLIQGDEERLRVLNQIRSVFSRISEGAGGPPIPPIGEGATNRNNTENRESLNQSSQNSNDLSIGRFKVIAEE